MACSTAAPESVPVAIAAGLAAVVVLAAPVALRLRGAPARRALRAA